MCIGTGLQIENVFTCKICESNLIITILHFIVMTFYLSELVGRCYELSAFSESQSKFKSSSQTRVSLKEGHSLKTRVKWLTI